MPSLALRTWQTHAAVGTGTRGRRYATRQINQAYTVLLASQFQRFCRDLHTECVERLLEEIASDALRRISLHRFIQGRRLDAGNANAGNLGSDFARLGVLFWPALHGFDERNRGRQRILEELGRWRNAFAHQDFAGTGLAGRSGVTLTEVRRWRRNCAALAMDMDRVMRAYLLDLTGTAPW